MSLTGQLFVIVEYCCNGSLRKYLLERRDSYIDTRDILRKGSDSSIEKKVDYSGLQRSPKANDYLSMKDMGVAVADSMAAYKMVGPAADADSSAATYKAGTDYVNLPKMQKGIRVDDEFPLTTKDLMCYSFQIARGMEYLSSKKVSYLANICSHLS